MSRPQLRGTQQLAADRVPASYGQRLMWLVDQFRGADGALNCPVLCRLRGQLDVSRLRAALDGLTARHQALRTTVSGRGALLSQHIHPPCPAPMTLVDLSVTPNPNAAADALAVELRTRIDTTVWPLRVTLFRIAAVDHLLCINVSHLVTDAWSCGILFRDLCALYQGTPLPSVGWQYANFCTFQRDEREGALRVDQEYWRRQLARLRLPAIPFKPQSPHHESASCARDLPLAVVTQLRELACAERTTLFVVMLAIMNVLLHQVTARNDIAICSLFANRTRPETKETIGFLANLLVLRTLLPEPASFLDALHQTHATATGAFIHQALPYQMLPLDEMKSEGRRPDDVGFQMMAEPIVRTTMGELDVEVLVPDGVGSRMEVELVLIPRNGFRAIVFYNRARVDDGWAEAFLSQYVTLASCIAKNPYLSLAALRRVHTS